MQANAYRFCAVNFDDHDWELGHPPTEAPRTFSMMWKVGAGVVIGMLLGASLVLVVEQAMVQAPHRQAAATLDTRARNASPAADRASAAVRPPLVELPKAPPARSHAASAAPTVTPRADSPRSAPSSPAGPGTIESSPEGAARRAAERRERAWASFYKKPADCDDSPPKADIVECANHFIRAKREFEQLYAAGKPAPATPAVLATPQARRADSVAAARSAAAAISTPQAMPRPSASRSAHSPERPGTRNCSNSIRPP